MSIRAILPAMVLALALAAPAAAKEIESLAVCGADGCERVTSKGDPHALLDTGPPAREPGKAAPFFRIRVAMGDGNGGVFERFSYLYVPSAEKVRGVQGAWSKPPTPTLEALDAVTRGRDPLPASALAQAKVGIDSVPPRGGEGPLPPEVINGPAPAPPSEDGAPAWLVVLLVGGGVAVLAGGLALLVRRRVGRQPRPVVAP